MLKHNLKIPKTEWLILELGSSKIHLFTSSLIYAEIFVVSCYSYHRTISPCSKKFFRLGSVCCRSGVVKPCWYLSCKERKKKKNTHCNIRVTHCAVLNRTVRVGKARLRNTLTRTHILHVWTPSWNKIYKKRQIPPTVKSPEVYILSPWHISTLSIRLLLIRTHNGHPSLITGMCANM